MIIKIYDYFRSHIRLLMALLLATTVLLACFVLHLSYKEDITDFLPLGTSNREALSIYQDISGAGELIVIFDNPDDADLTVSAIEKFCEEVNERDTLGVAKYLTAQFDLEKLSEVADFVYSNIPYFLTDDDYSRIDSILAQPDYIKSQMEADREMLLFPSGGLLSDNIGRDPLNIFTPVVSRLNKSQKQSHFEMYDSYIFSPDMTKALVLLPSPYGNSETDNNAKLVALLNSSLEAMHKDFPKVKAHVTGGPEIAVGNAHQIKKDSIIAVSISVILILLLLVYSFRSFRNIMLIVASISWGWLFALGCISLIHNNISIIVIGISSIIIGIAVNYPLHLIDHTNHEPNIRNALREIVVPLLVGNVTTIGAFLALVPLKSVALRDLGLFASLLLLGTIAFVLVFLPHMVKTRKKPDTSHRLFGRLTEAKIENKRWIVWIVVILTAVFSWFSLDTEFDSNMAHINYMTKEQRLDMEYFQTLTANDTTDNCQTLYVVSSGKNYDEALEGALAKQSRIDSLLKTGKATSLESMVGFVTSKKEQARRLAKWEDWKQRHASDFTTTIPTYAKAVGFSNDAFEDFNDIINGQYSPKDFGYFEPITQSIFKGNISTDKESGRYSVVDKLNVRNDDLKDVKDLFAGSFDVQSMNGTIANSLSNDFNYIGWACSLIVFLFLWFSFGRIELAILAFMPMAISWIWILGIMTLLGIKFNIVNVILATFIFGQGDDYTIFITEGCSYEYAYRKPMLASYKNSIILSALIMFIGIGSLIVAKHPAMLSLAEVTIIGMFSVVLMAYLVPPLIFNWLTRKNGEVRFRPLTLTSILGNFARLVGRTLFRMEDKCDASKDISYYRSLVADRYLYKGVGIHSAVKRQLASVTDERLKGIHGSTIRVPNNGNGAVALLLALVHPDKDIVAYEDDEELRLLAHYSAEGIATNIKVLPMASYSCHVGDTIFNLEEKK